MKIFTKNINKYVITAIFAVAVLTIALSLKTNAFALAKNSPPANPVIVQSTLVVKSVKYVTVTAYDSQPSQTDSTPFTTADMSPVRDGIIAANFLKFGTRVRIPELYGDKVFEVHDRMNSRFPNRVDIWMDSNQKSIQFGIKRNVKIEILADEPKTTAS